MKCNGGEWGFSTAQTKSEARRRGNQNQRNNQNHRSMRVNIPSNPGDLIALAKAINAKHIALGAASPLNGINGIAGFGAQVTAADTNNQQADLLYKQAETATEARDNALWPGHHHARLRPLLCDRVPRRAGRRQQRQRTQIGRLGFCGGRLGASHACRQGSRQSREEQNGDAVKGGARHSVRAGGGQRTARPTLKSRGLWKRRPLFFLTKISRLDLGIGV